MLVSISEQSFTQDVLGASTPVLVHFWAPWCGLCRAIEPTLVRFQSKWGDRVKLVDINADCSLKLASTYRLTSLPTLLWFEGARVVYRLEGFKGRDDLRHQLDEIATQYDRRRLLSRSLSKEYQKSSV
jgi:thioredoxin 1